jgi:hypothetical protein
MVWAAVYGLVFVLAVAMIQIAGGSADELTGTDAALSRAGALVFIAQWIGGGIHLGFQRRVWLRWKAQHEAVPWYAPTGSAPPKRGGEADIGPLGMAAPVNDYLAPAGTAAQVDLNTAASDDIARLPGVGIATATRLVSERDRRGGFDTLAEALEAAQIDAPTAERLVGTVWVSRPAREAPSGTGRVVDL